MDAVLTRHQTWEDPEPEGFDRVLSHPPAVPS